MAVAGTLKPVVAQPGQPLYQTVKQMVREAIDSGIFVPGEQMPSTKQLSETLSVSLVTAHRALQELVMAGVLQRTQGKGTFVHDRYARDRVISECRLGVVFNQEASLADFYHGQILEGARRGVYSGVGAPAGWFRGQCAGFWKQPRSLAGL